MKKRGYIMKVFATLILGLFSIMSAKARPITLSDFSGVETVVNFNLKISGVDPLDFGNPTITDLGNGPIPLLLTRPGGIGGSRYLADNSSKSNMEIVFDKIVKKAGLNVINNFSPSSYEVLFFAPGNSIVGSINLGVLTPIKSGLSSTADL